MPVYEFRCPQGHEFEKFYRTISGAEAQSACPQCGQLSDRMMSAAGFAFKGSGFYLTDYGKNAHREKGTPTPASPAAADGAKADGAKADAPKAEGSAAATASPAGDAKPAAVEPKPAPAAPKKSTGE